MNLAAESQHLRADPNPGQRNDFVDSLPKLREAQFMAAGHRGLASSTERPETLSHRDLRPPKTTVALYVKTRFCPALPWRRWLRLWILPPCLPTITVLPSSRNVDIFSAGRSAYDISHASVSSAYVDDPYSYV